MLLQATAIAGVYDFFVTTFHIWKEYPDFQFVPALRTLTDRARMGLSFDAISFILGLGFVMGLRTAAQIFRGYVRFVGVGAPSDPLPAWGTRPGGYAMPIGWRKNLPNFCLHSNVYTYERPFQ